MKRINPYTGNCEENTAVGSVCTNSAESIDTESTQPALRQFTKEQQDAFDEMKDELVTWGSDAALYSDYEDMTKAVNRFLDSIGYKERK